MGICVLRASAARVSVVTSTAFPSGFTAMLTTRSSRCSHTIAGPSSSRAFCSVLRTLSTCSRSRMASNSARWSRSSAERWPASFFSSSGAGPARRSVSCLVEPVAGSSEKALPSRTKNTRWPSDENRGFDSVAGVSVRRREDDLLTSTRWMSPPYSATRRSRSGDRGPAATSGPAESICASLIRSGAAPACARTRYGLSDSRHSAPGGSHRK